MILTYWAALACVCLTMWTPIATCASDATKPSQQKAGLVGQVQHIVEETYNPDKPHVRIIVTESYDKAGELSERIVALVDTDAPETNTKQRSEFVRDDSGRTKEERMYRDDGTPVSTQKYSYDQQGKLTQKVSHRVDGTEESRWKYVYDKHGKEKEAKYFIANILRARYLYEYDERGNRFKLVAFRGDGSEEHTSIDKYDDKNHRTETVVLKPGGAVDRKHTYRYNDKGYVIEEITFSTNGSMTGKHIYSYTFDQRGNWIKRTKSEWDPSSGKLEQTQIAERAISYYSN